MIIVPKIITPPESEPVTVAEVRDQLKLDSDQETDDFLNGKITTARQLGEKYSGLSFLTQEIEIKLERFPCSKYIYLPRGPVQSVDDFVYINSDGDSIPLVSGTDYIVDLSSEPARVSYVSSWPTAKDQTGAVTIAYTAGFANDDHDPILFIIKEAVLKTVARLCEKRGDTEEGPVLSEDIIDMYDEIKVYWNANID